MKVQKETKFIEVNSNQAAMPATRRHAAYLATSTFALKCVIASATA
jgi:hypothetical protein